MAWRDDLRAGTFRGAPFQIDRHNVSGGRRVAVHEYPQREQPWVEDLGRKADGFSLELYVLGLDYFDARDRLEAALREPGPGTLVHPYLGTLRVAVRSYRLRESTREGGIARFSVDFVEAGEQREPKAETDTPSVVTDKADQAKAAAESAFADSFSASGQPEFVRDEAESLLSDATDALEAAADAVPTLPEAAAAFRDSLSAFSNQVQDLVLKPLELAQEVTGLMTDLAGIVERPSEALRMYEQFSGFGDDAKPVPQTTPARIQQGDNQGAIHGLIQDAAAIGAARASSRQTWPSFDDAIATRDRIAERLDDRAEVAFDERYRTMADLRVAVVRDITARGADLARLGHYTPPQVMPALVLAHRIHGDASRDAEIVERNDVRHPTFVPGGDALEVLLDS